MPAIPEIRNLRFFVQTRPDTVPYKLAHHAESSGLNMFLHGRANIADRIPDACLLDPAVQRRFRDFQQLLQLRLQAIADWDCDRGISVISVKHYAAID
jgi:hypothetical protein